VYWEIKYSWIFPNILCFPFISENNLFGKKKLLKIATFSQENIISVDAPTGKPKGN
jgi:hypothetical protein